MKKAYLLRNKKTRNSVYVCKTIRRHHNNTVECISITMCGYGPGGWWTRGNGRYRSLEQVLNELKLLLNNTRRQKDLRNLEIEAYTYSDKEYRWIRAKTYPISRFIKNLQYQMLVDKLKGK